MKIDFVKALTWPSREAGSYVKVAVLTVFWMILIGIPLCLGYLVDSIKQVGEGEDDKMPNLEDFVGLLYKGVMLLLIGAIYGAIPLGILFTTFSGGVLTMLGSAFMGSASGAAGGLGLSMVGIIATGVVMVALWIVLPMALLRFASSGSVGSAFDFGGLFSAMAQGPLDYVAILILIPVLFKAGIFVLALIPVVGWILVLPFITYVGLVKAHLLGQYQAAYLASPDAA